MANGMRMLQVKGQALLNWPWEPCIKLKNMWWEDSYKEGFKITSWKILKRGNDFQTLHLRGECEAFLRKLENTKEHLYGHRCCSLSSSTILRSMDGGLVTQLPFQSFKTVGCRWLHLEHDQWCSLSSSTILRSMDGRSVTQLPFQSFKTVGCRWLHLEHDRWCSLSSSTILCSMDGRSVMQLPFQSFKTVGCRCLHLEHVSIYMAIDVVVYLHLLYFVVWMDGWWPSCLSKVSKQSATDDDI